MNVICLSPHFLENYIVFVGALHHRGARVLGLAEKYLLNNCQII